MKLGNIAKLTLATALATTTAFAAFAGSHASTKLRIQTHYAPETVSGKLATQYIDNIQTMSGGEIEVEMFYASSVVKSPETFDAVTVVAEADANASLMSWTMSSTLHLLSPLVSVLNFTSIFDVLLFTLILIP